MKIDSLVVDLLRELDEPSVHAHHGPVHLGAPHGKSRGVLIDAILLELAKVPREVKIDEGQDRNQEEHNVLPHDWCF